MSEWEALRSILPGVGAICVVCMVVVGLLFGGGNNPLRPVAAVLLWVALLAGIVRWG